MADQRLWRHTGHTRHWHPRRAGATCRLIAWLPLSPLARLHCLLRAHALNRLRGADAPARGHAGRLARHPHASPVGFCKGGNAHAHARTHINTYTAAAAAAALKLPKRHLGPLLSTAGVAAGMDGVEGGGQGAQEPSQESAGADAHKHHHNRCRSGSTRIASRRPSCRRRRIAPPCAARLGR
jgi:hypothetical protein